MTDNVNNGTANVTVSTAGLSEGQYRIQTIYSQNERYNTSSNSNGMITLTKKTRDEIGVSTDTPFTTSMFSDYYNRALSNGVITVNNDGTVENVAYHDDILTAYPLENDFRVTVTCKAKLDQRFGLIMVGLNPYIPYVSIGKDVSTTNYLVGDDVNSNPLLNQVVGTLASSWHTVVFERVGNTFTMTRDTDTPISVTGVPTNTWYLGFLGWSSSRMILKNIIIEYLV